MFIQKIFRKEFDEEVHNELIKYSKGEFSKKYLIEVKNKGSFYNIKTSYELSNYFVKKGLSIINSEIKIKGIIVSTLNLEIDFSKDKKNFMGIKKYIIDKNINSKEILDFMNKNPKVFFALSFSLPDYELKIKPKMPKSPKPSTKISENDESLSPNFCSLKTNKKEIIKEILFDIEGNFKEVFLEHVLKIEDIIYPGGFQKMKPEEIREKSKRKGRLIRKLIIDGEEKISEASFLA